MTVAARRNARLRAQALAAIPLLLFILAAIPRVWAPDLVPFDAWEAGQVAEARARSADSWAQAYANPVWPSLALVEPWMRVLPSPVARWVVLRGLLDALGIALLYLAVRPLVGPFGATLAGTLYAASPVAWGAARDPAGSLGPVLGAAALLSAVKLIERPSLLRGAVLGLLLGLLTRSLPLGLLVVPLGAVSLFSARASWKVGGLTAVALVLAAGPALFTPLAQLYNFPLPPNVAETRPLVFSPLVPLFLVAATVAALWHAKLGVGILFPMVWIVVGVAAGDFVWRTSLRTTPGALIDGVALLLRHVQPLLAALVLTVAFVVSPIRAVRWCGRIGGLIAVTWLLAGTAVSMRQDAEAARVVPVFTSGSGSDSAGILGVGARPSGSLYSAPSLREVMTVIDDLRETAERIGTNEAVLLAGHPDATLARVPYGLMLDTVAVRAVGDSMVLPLERELVYLFSAINPDSDPHWLAIEAQRPSSSVNVLTPDGADTGARVITLRPRPVADWLARVRAVPDGRFADGSVLLGVDRDAHADGTLDLTLYWQLPAAADGRTLGTRVQLLLDGAPPPIRRPDRQADVPGGETQASRNRMRTVMEQASGRSPGSAMFPPVEARRGGELVVQHLWLEVDLNGGRLPSLSVAVYDAAGQPIRTASGAADLALPLSR